MGHAWEESEIFRVNVDSLILGEQCPLGNGHLQHTAVTEHKEWVKDDNLFPKCSQ